MEYNRIQLSHFGPIPKLTWNDPLDLNVIIGENGVGKTFLMKAMYVAVRTLEDYKRGQSRKTLKNVLDEKLYWTFQSDSMGDLVTKGFNRLSCKAKCEGKLLEYSFSSSAEKGVGKVNKLESGLKGRSIYIPPYDVLNLDAVVRKSRTIDSQFGFDDTALDLIQALDVPPRKNQDKSFSEASSILKSLAGGELERTKTAWYFKQGNNRFPIELVAEGQKKLALIARLIDNGMLSDQSILFIDEPETALHPHALSKFIEVLSEISLGIDVFISTHSYFTLKKAYICGMKKKNNVSCLSITKQGYKVTQLADGLPDNPIVQSSIDLYEEEMAAELER